MPLSFTIQRWQLNLKRYQLFTVLTAVILVVIFFFMWIIYPGPEFVDTMLSIPIFQLLVGLMDVENPGFLVWILLIHNILSNIIYPVIGIFFGIRILPFNEKDGKELIFSTNKSPLTYFLENLLLVFILIPLVMLPSYLLGVSFLLFNGVLDGIYSFTIAFILPIFFTFVTTLITSLGCSIWSSTTTGLAFGSTFFISSFTLNMLQQEIDFVQDINLMSQINLFEHTIAETWNQNYIATCGLLIIIFSILTIFFLYRTDYIGSRSSYTELIGTKNKKGILAKFSFIRTVIRAPVEFLLTKLGWKYPAFRDQLQASAGLILIYTMVTSFLIAVVAIVYPGDAAMEAAFSGLDMLLKSPLLGAFLFDHTVTASLEGFILYKLMVFHWIYYGPFLFVATYSIIMRDSSAGYDEITYSMPRSRSRIIVERTLATLVYLWIMIIINWLVLWIGQLILITYITDVVMTDFTGTTLAFIFLGIGYSIFLIIFVAISLIPPPKYLFITMVSIFLSAIFIPILWYMNQDLSWLLYLSPFGYFDIAGLLLNDIKLFEKVIPETFTLGVISLIFLYFVVKYWAPTKDIF